MAQITPAERMAHFGAQATTAAMVTQGATLGALLAEMQALAQLMPGNPAPHGQADADAIEAAFDNMPV